MHRLEIDQMLSPLSFVRFKSHKVYIIAYDAVLVATGIAILSGLSGSMPHFAIAFSSFGKFMQKYRDPRHPEDIPASLKPFRPCDGNEGVSS